MKVFGIVVDEQGDPIPGANIASAAYNNIVEASDKNGKFELTSDKITNISPIKISYVGFKDKYVTAKDLQGSKVALSEDIIALNEVVVTRTPVELPPIKSENAQTNIINHVKKYQGPYIVLLSLGIIGISLLVIKKVA